MIERWYVLIHLQIVDNIFVLCRKYIEFIFAIKRSLILYYSQSNDERNILNESAGFDTSSSEKVQVGHCWGHYSSLNTQ